MSITLPPPPRELTSPHAEEQWREKLYRKILELESAGANAPGVIKMFGGASAPEGYLTCDGSSVSQTTYADLFAAVGTAWDTFNGAAAPVAGNFRVPDLRGRAPIGVGTGSGLTARALAAAVGAETHTLTSAEMPSHTHTQDAHRHNFYGRENSAAGASTRAMMANGSGNAQNYSGTEPSDNATAVNQSTGGGGAHANMQPSAAVNFIIKT